MMSSMRTKRTFAGIAVIAVAAIGLGCVTPAHAQDAGRGMRPCVIIDTDVDIDDLRAIPAVVATRNVVGIVVTTGAGEAKFTSSALAKLLAEPNDRSIPVIVGATNAKAPLEDWVWLPPVRAQMATANGYLSEPTPAPPYSRSVMRHEVRKVTRGCEDIELLIIGPLTSFVKYSPMIRDRVTRVVLQGRPYSRHDSKTALEENFNCGYDVRSCKLGREELRGLDPVWVDLPSLDAPYQPTLQAVSELRTTGLPGAFRTAYLATLWTWEPGSLSPGNLSLLWDDSAAMYLLSTKGFTKTGNFWAPSMSAEALRATWVRAVNSWHPSTAN